MGGKGWKGLVFHPAERIIQIVLLRGKEEEEEEEEEGGAAPSLSALPRKTVSKVGKEMRLIPMRWRERRRRRRRRLSISTVPPTHDLLSSSNFQLSWRRLAPASAGV